MVNRPCQRCGAERPSARPRYCSDACAKEAVRERTRDRDDKRIKPCPNCGKPKERGKRRLCAACREAMLPVWRQQEYARSRARWEAKKASRTPAKRMPREGPDGTLRCTACEQYLPVDRFSTAGAGRRNAYCKVCYSAYAHDRMLRKTYGIDAGQYEQLLQQQDGRCAICLKRPRTRRLAVDHDHMTGEVRGLLCSRCNHKLLGGANDSPAMLYRAAAYLEAPPARTGSDPALLPDYWEQRLAVEIEAAEDANAANPDVLPVAQFDVDGTPVAAMSGATFVGLLRAYERAVGVPLTIVVQEDQ